MRSGWLWCVVVAGFSSVAEAQLRVVAATDQSTPVGEIRYATNPSINDDGHIAFISDGVAMLWKSGTFSLLADPGAPAPCGGGTISGVGNGLGGVQATALRGLWAVFDIYDSLGVQRRVGSYDGTLRCMASVGDTTPAGSLAGFQAYAITNEPGEVLVDDSHLFLVPNAGGSYTQVAGMGVTLPLPPDHTGRNATYWSLADDGDVTVVVQTEQFGGLHYHALHGRPGAMTLIEPLGIGVDDEFEIFGSDGGMIGANRSGIVAYEAWINPPSPGVRYTGIWTGAPGATTNAFNFPKAAGNVTVTELYNRPQVISASHFIAEMRIESTSGPRRAIVRWNGGALTLIAATGAPLPDHPSVIIDRFGGVGVDDAGNVFFQVVTGAGMGGVYRAPIGGPIEKILASGDTLDINGTMETIREAGFDTTRGTGYATSVSPTGKIVFYATYQGGTKIALVTFGAAQGPAPDLVIELGAPEAYYDRDNHSLTDIVMTISNVGAGTSEFPVVVGQPADLFRCDNGEPGSCLFGPLAPGATVTRTLTFDSSNRYDFMLEVYSDGQDDADPSNNVISGTMEQYLKGGSGLCSAGGERPYAVVPLLLSLAFVLRRRSTGRSAGA